MKYVPNTISAIRLVAAMSLLLLTPYPKLFAVVFCLVGLTDVLDGYLARHYHVESKLGAKLDNIADTMVFVVGFISLIFLLHLRFDNTVLCLLPLFIGVAAKVFSFALTKVRFHEWNTMHTYSNKALGVILFSCIPVSVLLGEINHWLALAVSVLICATVIEDTYILLTSEEYNVDHKGILAEKILARRQG